MTSMTNLALVYLKEKKYDQCIDVCDRALEVDSSIHKAYFYKGKALTEKTDYQKAIDVLKQFVDLTTRKVEEKAKAEEEAKLAAAEAEKKA